MYRDLRFGIFVTLKGDSEYMQDCYREYGMVVDETGVYTRASIGMRREPTGCPAAFSADVAAVAKFDLPAGTVLDGEGGYHVYGEAVPARTSMERKLLPLNFTANKRILRDIKAGEFLTLDDIEYDPRCLTMQMWKEMADLIK